MKERKSPMRETVIAKRLTSSATLLTTAVLLFCSLQAHAIVNVDKLHIGSSQEGLNGSISARASGSSGNTNTSRIRLGTTTQWKHGQRIEILSASYQKGSSLGTTDINNAFLHARHVEGISTLLALEGFGQIESDEFARLNFRGLIGAGVRMTVGELTPRQGVYFGLGGFWVQEDISPEANTSDSGKNSFIRANIYLVLKRELAENVELYTTTYIQPAINEAGDLRLLEDLTVKLKITDRLAVNLSLDITHDSKPPATVKQTDIQYATGLELKY